MKQNSHPLTLIFVNDVKRYQSMVKECRERRRYPRASAKRWSESATAPRPLRLTPDSAIDRSPPSRWYEMESGMEYSKWSRNDRSQITRTPTGQRPLKSKTRCGLPPSFMNVSRRAYLWCCPLEEEDPGEGHGLLDCHGLHGDFSHFMIRQLTTGDHARRANAARRLGSVRGVGRGRDKGKGVGGRAGRRRRARREGE